MVRRSAAGGEPIPGVSHRLVACAPMGGVRTPFHDIEGATGEALAHAPNLPPASPLPAPDGTPVPQLSCAPASGIPFPSSSMPPAACRRAVVLRRIFGLLAAISIIINLDGGAVPAGLIHIRRTFDLTTIEVGLLGMLVYQGIAIGCVVAGPLLRCVSPLRATQATLVLNILATLGFGASWSTPALLVFRALIGVLQAVPAVYFPVWVDEFAPKNAMTTWMAVANAGAPLGITIGYGFSGSLAPTGESADEMCPADSLWCRWRMPFYAQSVTLICLAVMSLFIPKELYDIGHKLPSADGDSYNQVDKIQVKAAEGTPRRRRLAVLLCELLSNGTFCCTVIALSAFFFVVTGIQFWVTDYLVTIFQTGQEVVTPTFSAVAIGAPLLGVAAGGTFIDWIGGYNQVTVTLKWCFIFAVCAAASGICCAYSPVEIAKEVGSSTGGFGATIGLIALTLIFGGAVVPPATGCLVAVVAEDVRQISMAVSMFTFQQLGYALSPMVSAIIASLATIDRQAELTRWRATINETNATQAGYLDDALHRAELKLGFEVVMLCGLCGVIFLFCAWQFSLRNDLRNKRQKNRVRV